LDYSDLGKDEKAPSRDAHRRTCASWGSEHDKELDN
jgi:hypothetical protein